MNSIIPVKDKFSKAFQVILLLNVFSGYLVVIYECLGSRIFLTPGGHMIKQIQLGMLFAVNYLAEPLGGIVWGYTGDKLGIRYMLRTSFCMMAIVTACIGLFPSYDLVEVVMTTVLFALGFIKRFASSSILPLSLCYISKSVSTNEQGILYSIISLTYISGEMLSAFIISIIGWFFSNQASLNVIWRVLFLLSIPMGLWAIHSLQPEKKLQGVQVAWHELFDITEQWQLLKQLFLSRLVPFIVLVGFMEVVIYMSFTCLPVYINAYCDLSKKIPGSLGDLAIFLSIPSLLCASYLAKMVGYRQLLIWNTLIITVFSYPLFYIISVAPTSLVFIIHMVFIFLTNALQVMTLIALGEAYPEKVRCLGISMTYTIGVILFSRIIPSLYIGLIINTGVTLLPIFIVIGVGCIALASLWWLRRLSDKGV